MSLTTHSFPTYFHFSTASSTGDISWRLKIQRKIRRGSAPPSSPTGLSPGVGKKVPVHKLDHVLINSHSHEVCVVCFLQEAHISKGPSLLRSSLLEMLAISAQPYNRHFLHSPEDERDLSALSEA